MSAEVNENVPMRSRELFFVFDARDCVPNGERMPGFTGPRIDPLTRRSLISDISFKRMIRDYLLTYQDENNRVMVRQEFKYSKTEGRIAMKNIFLDDLTDNGKIDISKMDTEKLLNIIKENFIDHRLFGSIFYLNQELKATTGPIQFENTYSYNKPNIIDLRISSTLASESGKDAGSLGNSVILDYAVFPVHGISKESLSKISGATENDIKKLFDSMWNGLLLQNTRTKIQQMPRLLVSVIMKDARTHMPEFKDAILLVDNNVSCFDDCVFDLTNFRTLVEIFSDKIDAIEYREGIRMKYQYKETNFSTFKEISKFISRCPPLELISDYFS